MSYGTDARIKTRSGITFGDLGLINDAALDALIAGLNEQISGLVDGYCGRDFAHHVDVTETLEGNGRPKLRLPGYPIISVASVTVNGTVYAATDYRVLPGGVLENRKGLRVWPYRKEIEIVYTYGYATPPGGVAAVVEDLAKAALQDAARGHAAQGVSSMSMDGYSVAYSELARNIAFSAEHLLILDRYRVTGGA